MATPAIPNIPNVAPSSGTQPNPNIQDFLRDVFTTLGLTANQANQITSQLDATFTGQQLQMIINNDQLRTLIEADTRIANLQNDPGLTSLTGTNAAIWNSFKQNLGKLQVLAILKKIRQGDCDATIQTIVEALNAKLQAVNTILESNLQSGGGKQSTNSINDPYYHKFLKYKFKYMLAKYENKFQ